MINGKHIVLDKRSSRWLHILCHSLGLDQYGEGKQYRNHFCTGPGSTDFDDCQSLVELGMMTSRPGNEISGGDTIFSVTQKGIDFVMLNKTRKHP